MTLLFHDEAKGAPRVSERQAYPSEKQDRFIIRLPDGMRDRIRAAAEANGRSMNAEVVSVLEQHFPEPKEPISFREVYELMSYVEAGQDYEQMIARAEEVNSVLNARGSGISIKLTEDPRTGEIGTHMSVR